MSVKLDRIDPRDLHVKEVTIMQDSEEFFSIHSDLLMSTAHKTVEIEATVDMNLYEIQEKGNDWYLVKKNTGYTYDGDKMKKQLREMSVLGVVRDRIGLPDLQINELSNRERKLFLLIEELMYPKNNDN